MDLLSFPISLFLAALFLLVLFGTNFLFEKSKFTQFFAHRITSLSLLGVYIILLFVEGFGVENFHKNPFSVCVAFLLTFSLGSVILRRIKNNFNITFLLHHGGIFFVFFGMIFGASDRERIKTYVVKNEPIHKAWEISGREKSLPFGIILKNFETQNDEKGMPSQYFSTLKIVSASDTTEIFSAVNAPANFQNWKIYTENFDGSRVVLQLVKDPWIWVVYLGFALLLLGAISIILNFKK